MSGTEFFLFGEYETHLQGEYEREIAGVEDSNEINRIRSKYESRLSEYEDRFMAPVAEQVIRDSLSASLGSPEEVLEFMAYVRQKYYGDTVDAHRVFSIPKYDDIKKFFELAFQKEEANMTEEIRNALKVAKSVSTPAKINKKTIREIKTNGTIEEQFLYIDEFIAMSQRDEKRAENIFLQKCMEYKAENDYRLSRRAEKKSKVEALKRGEITSDDLKELDMEIDRGAQIAVTENVMQIRARTQIETYVANVLGIDEVETSEVLYALQSTMTSEQRITKLNFQFDMYERINEELALEIQIDRFNRLFLGKIRGGERDAFLYRSGFFPQEQDSIDARSPEKLLTAVTHVAYGSTSRNYDSPFISTTIDPLIMSIYTTDTTDLLGKRASQMIIDCGVLQDVMKERLELIKGKETVLPNEIEFLRVLSNSPAIQEREDAKQRIEERIQYLSSLPLYMKDYQLPSMINPMIRHKMIEEDIAASEAGRDDTEVSLANGEPEGVYSLAEFGGNRLEKALVYGATSLEVPIQGRIPITHYNVYGIPRKITFEMEALQSDLIQSLNLFSGSEIRSIIDFQNDGESRFTQGLRRIIYESNERSMNPSSSGEEPLLTPLEARFAELYYIENKPLSEIKLKLPGLADKDDFEILVISERLRNEVLEKFTSDPEIAKYLTDGGIGLMADERPVFLHNGVIPFNVSKSLKDEQPLYNLPSDVRQTRARFVDEKGDDKVVHITPKEKTVRREAEKAARAYIKTVENLISMEIS